MVGFSGAGRQIGRYITINDEAVRRRLRLRLSQSPYDSEIIRVPQYLAPDPLYTSTLVQDH